MSKRGGLGMSTGIQPERLSLATIVVDKFIIHAAEITKLYHVNKIIYSFLSLDHSFYALLKWVTCLYL